MNLKVYSDVTEPMCNLIRGADANLVGILVHLSPSHSKSSHRKARKEKLG